MAALPLTYEDFVAYTPYSTIGPYRTADFLLLPEGERVELLKGRLIESPCPAPLHQIVALELAIRLRRIADARGDVLLTAPMDVVLSDHTALQPDVLLLRAANRHRLRDRIYGPVDLAVEVLSPSTNRRDRIEKLALYAEYGVCEYWIVDPEVRVFDFLTLRNDAYQLVMAQGDVYQSPSFPEIQLNVTDFWRVIDRRLPQ
jgi:Uma2 family endonuclease